MRRQAVNRGAAQVLVVGVDARGMGLIRECLGTEAVLPNASTPYPQAIDAVVDAKPNVVITGFDGDFEEAVRLGPLLSSEIPGLQLVAISEKTDPERIRAAMRAGYREYVVLPEDSALLRQAVRESDMGGPGPNEDQGQLISVVGSKGGVGTTTLAVNLASELSPVQRVCMVDLDFSMGDVAAFLDLQPKSSFQDLLGNIARLDQRMLAGSVSVHPSKTHVLAQPNELIAEEHVSGEQVLRVLTVVADTYQYVFADCGGRIDDATLTTTAVSDLILLVCNPDVPSVKNAWRRLNLMERQGIDKSLVRLVVNKWRKGMELSLGDIEKSLGIPVAATVTYDEDTCLKSINAGKILRDVDKRSQTVADISAMVSLITDGATKVQAASSEKKAFGWLFK
ncbi:MAG: AAA family ATPase [Alphaproteobacteria bacterium]|nr:AAA family ATPase [Alphaproteobacteria bacterium]